IVTRVFSFSLTRRITFLHTGSRVTIRHMRHTADPAPPPLLAAPALVEASLAECQTKRLLRHRALARLLAPLRVGGEEVPGRGPRVASHTAAVLDEVSEHVHRGAIAGGRLPHRLREAEAVALPRETPFHRPPEDARRLGLQLLDDVLVLLVVGDADGERDEADAVPDRLVGALDQGPVVCRQPELELWPELEPLSLHELGR